MPNHDFERNIWQRVLVSNGFIDPELPQGTEHEQAVMLALQQELRFSKVFQMLAGRVNGNYKMNLLRLSKEARMNARQLETIYYLLTGVCADTTCEEPCACGCICEVLREQYGLSIRAAQGYQRAAECYAEYACMYTELKNKKEKQAQALRCMLQTLL